MANGTTAPVVSGRRNWAAVLLFAALLAALMIAIIYAVANNENKAALEMAKGRLSSVKAEAEKPLLEKIDGLEKIISAQEQKLAAILAEKTGAPPAPAIPAGMSLVNINNDELKRLVDCCADKATKAKAKGKKAGKKGSAKKSGAAFAPAVGSALAKPRDSSPATVFPPAATHGDCFQLTLPRGQ